MSKVEDQEDRRALMQVAKNWTGNYERNLETVNFSVFSCAVKRTICARKRTVLKAHREA
jgi:hypothetical protein